MAHETLGDRIESWRVATDAVTKTPDNQQVREERNALRKELEADLFGSGKPDPDPLGTALAAVALEGRSEAEIRAELQNAVLGNMPPPLPMVEENGRKLPVPIMTRDEGSGVVLAEGEAGVLGGAGGGGKSRLALQLAIAAAGTGTGNRIQPFGKGGPELLGGPAVYLAYEDNAAWMELRAKRIAQWLGGNKPCQEQLHEGSKSKFDRDAVRDPKQLRLYCPDYAGALFEVAPSARAGTPEALPRPTAWWHVLWESLREMAPTLIVVDPVALAYAVDGYGAVGVGRFIGAIRRQLVQLPKPCCAVLIAHTSRAGRRQHRDEADATPMGSVAWIDRPRAVLMLEPDTDTNSKDVFNLKLVKANYARCGTLASLKAVHDDQHRPIAFELAERSSGNEEEWNRRP